MRHSGRRSEYGGRGGRKRKDREKESLKMRREEVERIFRRGEKMSSIRKGVVFRGGEKRYSKGNGEFKKEKGRRTARERESLKRRREDAQQGKGRVLRGVGKTHSKGKGEF